MKKAFTLAEVLITLTIIGVVAAIVLPGFIGNMQKKVRTEQNRTVLYKLTKATDQMKSVGLIGPYDSTEAFINELKRHFKIAQVCKNDNLENCWPTKTFLTTEGEEIAVKDLKTGTEFGTEGYTRDNLGLITADGTAIIMSYKDDCEALEAEKMYTWSTEDGKPVTNATTSCIAMIYELNGKARPNQTNEDIRLFNVAKLGSHKPCGETGGICISTENVPYTPLDVTASSYLDIINELGVNRCDEGTCRGSSSPDAWAGAAYACKQLGGRLPTAEEWATVASTMFAKTINPRDKNTIYGNITNYHNIAGTGGLEIYWIFEDLGVNDGSHHTAARYFSSHTNGTYGGTNYQDWNIRYNHNMKARCVFD